MLPVVPPGTILAGVGMSALIERFESRRPFLRMANRQWAVLAFVGLLLVLSVGVTALLWFTRENPDVKAWEADRQTGLAVRSLTDPGSLIIVVDGQMDGTPPEKIMTPPNVFYFGERHGWYRAMSWLTEDMIEQLRREGGRYFVVTGNAKSVFEGSHANIRNYLAARYMSIMDDERGIVYDLSARPASGSARSSVAK
jgi:hypothetical protein